MMQYPEMKAVQLSSTTPAKGDGDTRDGKVWFRTMVRT